MDDRNGWWIKISIFRQPFEHHGYKGGLDSALLYYLLSKYGTGKGSLLDQFPGGEVVKNVASQVGLECVATRFPVEDARQLEYEDSSFGLVLAHPPYWNSIRYSESPSDLANCETYEEFLVELSKSLDEAIRVLAPDGFFIFICGDIRRSRKLTLTHSDVYQYMKRYKNVVLRDDVWWELSASSTPMLATQWIIQGTHCLIYEKVGHDVGEYFA